ncbi:putative serine/threonine-protein kinase iksA [Cyphellophora attinorum]|uniref:non-specific serine/threonine protein kinase n=1 Tax=Cyphellophora attinorum TaxID=1664694 RepID=A0A0N1HBC8_9EURO|nr:putative serine/threonine-protein kinase iksA [Phialophora attinorum]KPI45842.1 putative serine/threonine-protein kinase iksA [Phialophora attinorum]
MSDSEREEVSGSGLSIIPYDNNRDLALRHADTVVYFDPRTNVPTLFRDRGTHDLERRSNKDDHCPTCNRPWHEAGNLAGSAGPPTAVDEPNFITSDYFQRLALSLPGSAEPSAPPSPRRRLAQPVINGPRTRSRLASPAADRAATPPPNAEFVGSSPAPPSAANGISEAAFAPQYFQKFFTVERELGRGGRGVVLLVKHILDGVHLGRFACKRVPIGDDHGWLEKVLVEVQALTQLSHQNLVSYRHVWLEDFKINAFSPSVPCAFILQQYCNGGDLHNYVCSDAQTVPSTQQLKERIRRHSRGETDMPLNTATGPKKLHFDEIYSFFRDITAGLRFLHHHSFVHRDLKPSNCLLHTVADETRVLVSDFGEVQYENAARKSTGATGTISYCAPEVLQRASPDGSYGNFTFKSDIFSLGMILHFMCFADLPYASADVLFEEREDVDKLRAEISAWAGFDERKKQRPDLPGELYPFLKRLLSIDPQFRPTAEEVDRGVSTGRLSDLMPELSRRRGSVPMEELTPGRRIQKLDTPKEGNSPQRPPSDGKAGPGLLLRPNRPLATNRPRSQERTNPASRLSQHRGRTQRDGTARRSPRGFHVSNAANLDSSLILRPRQRQTTAQSMPTSPVTEQPPPSLHSPVLERKPQLLLPPAPRQSSRRDRIAAFATRPVDTPLVRSLILLAKVFSVLHPCLSISGGGLNTAAIYPLIVLAVTEFSLPSPPRVHTSMLFAFVHGVALTMALRWGLLCSPSSSIWTWSRRNGVDELWNAGHDG